MLTLLVPNRGHIPSSFCSVVSQVDHHDVYEFRVISDGKKSSASKPKPMRVYYTTDLMFCVVGAQGDADGPGTPSKCILESRGHSNQTLP
ncbi:hypothetical protein LZ30DRAFT_704512, partial [Colletotrichum cereale]